ncbi:MAG: acetate/propionate family kinase [Acidobacteriota bacterium]
MAAIRIHKESSTKPNQGVLTINGGSSTIRFAIYNAGERLVRVLKGKIDRIGLDGATLAADGPNGKALPSLRLSAPDQHTAVDALLGWLEVQPSFATLGAVGHRVVHGMKHSEPERITSALLTELRRITPYAPDHLPGEIGLIDEFRKRHPKLLQVACFDTAFHRAMPPVARLLPIPRRLSTKGVERYGFHGLSYAYMMEELGRVDPKAARGRVILAHLGNGASLAAVRDGNSIDTSMGFTPSSGLMMSTRTGDLDPGLIYYLARTEHMTAAQFHRMVNHESGLLGVSKVGSDMRDLLSKEAANPRVAEAVGLYCYQAKKWIGSFAAALGGLDTLVFAGGVGENAPTVRTRICEGLGFLGVELSKLRNAKAADIISTDSSCATVRVIRTDEELMIARSVCRILGHELRKEQ